MATFFLRIRSHFVNMFNKISWESPKITSPKSPKTSDSWNTKILPIPTAISTKTGPFELKYKGRRTRNTQVCRHKITAYVYLLYMASCARPISEKLVFEPFLKSWFSLKKSFCKNRPHMAALGKVLEAKCLYFDVLSFMCSPHPAQNIALYIIIFVFGVFFLAKTLFHLEPPLD